METNIQASMLDQIRLALHDVTTVPPSKAKVFFKTGEGEYAQHDVFIGVTVPNLRAIAKTFSSTPLEDLQTLLSSKINEERLLALFILVKQYQKADAVGKETLYQFYMANLSRVNNWNLVDASAHLILGAHLWDKDRAILLTLVRSESLWDRRIAIVATWYFIRNDDLLWTFTLARILLNDQQDLMHKAAGWMLREAGERNKPALCSFLDEHATVMPRTMLRYSIEKFPEPIRKDYLARRTVVSKK